MNTTIEPKAPITLTPEEVDVLLQIMLPIADRAHKFVQAQSLTAEQEQALYELEDRLEDAAELTESLELLPIDKAITAFVLGAESWAQLLGLDEDEQRTLEALINKVNA